MTNPKVTKPTVSFKTDIYHHCYWLIENKLQLLEESFRQSREDLEKESKSTAGDKHETGRAMIQLEQEKMSQQLLQTEKLLQALKQVPFKKKSHKVESGALVQTSLGLLFISVGLGETNLVNDKVYILAPSAPLVQSLLGAEEGAQINFRKQVIDVYHIA